MAPTIVHQVNTRFRAATTIPKVLVSELFGLDKSRIPAPRFSIVNAIAMNVNAQANVVSMLGIGTNIIDAMPRNSAGTSRNTPVTSINIPAILGSLIRLSNISDLYT